MPRQVRVLTLVGGENRETTLYRLEKGWILRFQLGPSLHASPVRIFCNHPASKQNAFDRGTYREIELKNPSGSKIDRHDVYAEIITVTSGSFNYYFSADGSVSPDNADGSGYFLVDPTLKYVTDEDDEDDEDEDELPLDCIQCQTVLSKLLGPFNEWEGRLRVSYESGYNFIHFTPIQELGHSHSAYSLRDQRKLNPSFNIGEKAVSYNDVKMFVNKMVKDWKVLSMTDLVLNHTSSDSPWLLEHPECGYNLVNSPYLKSAYLMDRILFHFSVDVGQGKYESKGIPSEVDSHSHLGAIDKVLRDEIFPKYKLHEFYTVDIESVMREFRKAIQGNRLVTQSKPQLQIIQDEEYRRNKSTIDIDTALKLYNTDRPGVMNRDQRISACCEDLKAKLHDLNNHKMSEINDHVNVAITNFVANAKYRFVDGHGPRLGLVSKKEPLMHNYFVQPTTYVGTVESEETMMYGEPAALIMAVNGWVMGDDPLRNFAEIGSNVYLRRELIPWGDSCKLRFGKTPENCPYLWQHMKDYAETTAKIFHGIRLDNCHSTPMHVAEYMIDAARKIRPDLYVIAELFTGSEGLDNLFMNRLGITSLIREAMSAPDAHEEGRLVYKYGGSPVGSFAQPRVKPLVPTTAHALFFDQTHDNMSPVETRSPYDLFPSSALVSMACCATGSNRGYDQMVPHHIHVVKERRLYTSWAHWDFPEKPYINQTFGITAAKKFLNQLHFKLGKNGFSEVYVDQLTHDTVSVTRHDPLSHDSVVMIARTAFSNPGNPEETGYIRPLVVQGVVTDILFEGRVRKTDDYKYEKDPKFINGLPNFFLEMKFNFSAEHSRMISLKPINDGKSTEISFNMLTPGSVVVVKTVLPEEARGALLDIRRGLSQFGYLMRSYSGRTMFNESFETSNFYAIVDKLTLADLNRVLYRCDGEERADGKGFGAYNIPGYGSMVYCGLRGVLSVLTSIRSKNDLGHPLCNNLREGDWLPQYIANRLKAHPSTELLGKWFSEVFDDLSKIPRFLIPCYFDAIITGAFVVIKEQVVKLMSDFIQDGSSFVQSLALASLQFCGYVADATLPKLSPNMRPPRPSKVEQTEVVAEKQQTEVVAQKQQTEVVAQKSDSKTTTAQEEATLSIAAGLPHFGSGYMRNWGRDTFIALRGVLLLTGRYDDARFIILSFGACLRHGLIPNLLNKGSGARYNCRDAVWWWLQSIQDYCKMVEGGTDILSDKVCRLYPSDDSECEEVTGTHDQPLYDVIQEALQRHAEGLQFTERNAGPKIDDQMTSEGFQNEIGVQWELGFVVGGNEWNCGTWMDKMGSSPIAGNKGKPATPRCGSAVELVGLTKSAVRWMIEMYKAGKYPYDSVSAVVNGKTEKVTFKEWGEKIKVNFERHFWINTVPVPQNEPHPELINRRSMYKDSYFSKPFWSDFQLRPNFVIAMVVAPELFTPENAWTALTEAGEVLVGPLGMKTLDPRDWAYVGDYDNSNDTADPNVARGFNYHNGPEWVWPLGYFLRAKLHFAKIMDAKNPGLLKGTIKYVKSRLTKHYEEVMKAPWQSLPELTNTNGAYCKDSCPAQAWSIGCIMEVLYEMEQIGDYDELGGKTKSAEKVANEEKTVIV